jgi:aspartyl/asparaginyl beta-hydroxylase (cupin superfamily)
LGEQTNRRRSAANDAATIRNESMTMGGTNRSITMRYPSPACPATIRVTEKPHAVNATSITEPEARALADAINQVSATQPAAEAMKLIERALARAPEQPIVLNSAGGHMLKVGQPAQARDLYRRAISIDASSPVLWLNLAAACRSIGDTAAESESLERALALEPRYVAALLHKADLLERLGKPMAAVQMFEAALASIAPGITIPPHMAPIIAHAREVVSANARALEGFLARELEPLRRLHAGEDQHRYDACRDILLGKRRAYSSLPKDTYFPYLPAIEFFRREDFPWLGMLEEATEDIAAEALAALQRQPAEFSPYVNFPPGTPLDEWAPLNRSMKWTVYSLLHDGSAVPAHQAACPKTAAVLAQLPLCDIPGYAPGAYFSVLEPRTRLPPHTGTTNTRSIVHLPLVIPDGCRFRVGSQVRSWDTGQAWVFDDTIEHEAWNESDRIRIVLIFDIWNPLLTTAERDLVRAMTVARGRFFGADAPTMGSR